MSMNAIAQTSDGSTATQLVTLTYDPSLPKKWKFSDSDSDVATERGSGRDLTFQLLTPGWKYEKVELKVPYDLDVGDRDLYLQNDWQWLSITQNHAVEFQPDDGLRVQVIDFQPGLVRVTTKNRNEQDKDFTIGLWFTLRKDNVSMQVHRHLIMKRKK